MGLGAVPGRQAAFREGLEQAVLYAKALGCPRYPVLASLDHRAGWEESCEQRHCCGRGLCRLLFVFHLLVSFRMSRCYHALLIPGSCAGSGGLVRELIRSRKQAARLEVW